MSGFISRGESESVLLSALAAMRSCQWVDLTHAFDSTIPHCPCFSPEERRTLFSYEGIDGGSPSGFLAHEYRFVGQWGTHVDPPAHFVQGLRFQHEIPVTEMILPLVVLDVSEHVAKDDDYCVSMWDVQDWEAKHGRIPAGSFVALRTDWSKRWPDEEAMFNRDAQGIAHFPGWSREVLAYLYDFCGITASGHETTDTDCGITVTQGDAPLERFILAHDKWQIELLTNLDRVPPTGAIVVATWPKARQGSGFPARVFAVVPAENKNY